MIEARTARKIISNIHVDGPVLFLSGVVILALFRFPFVVQRPSRVMSGTKLWVWDCMDARQLGLLLVFCLLFMGLSLIPFREQVEWVKGMLAVVFMMVSLALLGDYAAGFHPTWGSMVRISPASGWWIVVLSTLLVFSQSLYRLQGQRSFQLCLCVSLMVGCGVLLCSGSLDQISIIKEYYCLGDRFAGLLLAHLKLTAFAVVMACLVGIPLGMTALRSERCERTIFFWVNVFQTIPSLALFGLLMIPLAYLSWRFPYLRMMGIKGVGMSPALLALSLYSLLPISRNTYVGMKLVDPSIMEAGKGMGMNAFQLLKCVQIPLALPAIIDGIRIASVQTIGNAALAALIGAGGLGTLIFQGIGQAAEDLILLGCLSLVMLAGVVEWAFQSLVRYFNFGTGGQQHDLF